MTLSRTLGLAVAAALTLIVVVSPASLTGPPPGQEKDRSAEDAQAQREYDKAVRLTRSGRAQEALEHFEKALPRMNGGSDIFYNLVMVSEAAKRWDKVLLYAQGFLVLEPGSDDAAEIEQKLDIAVKRLTKAKRAPAPVTFTVDPPEARVLVESTPIASAERPTALFVPGKHTAEATLADYTPATVAFEVKAGEEPAAVALRLVKIIYEGTLAVVTEPAAGVEVWLDDKKVGVTPLAPLKLPTLRYLVRLEKPGFDRWVRYVQLERDETTTVKATLEALKSR